MEKIKVLFDGIVDEIHELKEKYELRNHETDKKSKESASKEVAEEKHSENEEKSESKKDTATSVED